MKKTMAAISTMLFSLVLAGSALAAEHEMGETGGVGVETQQGVDLEKQPPGPAVAQEQLAPHQQGDLREAASLMGQTVTSKDGKELGTVSNLLVDMDTGQIHYLTVSTSGEADAAVQEYAVPWKAVERSPETEELALDISQDKFRNAPEGTELGTRQQEEEIFEFYGVAPYWEEAEPAQPGAVQEEPAEESELIEIEPETSE